MKFLQQPFLLVTLLLPLFFAQNSYADFVNGGFESTYTPSGSSLSDPITGWTLTGYTFNGNASTAIPNSLADINITANTTYPNGISDIINGSTQTLQDYFLAGSLPTPTLLLPVTGLQSASINLRSQHAMLGKSGNATISGWTSVAQQATMLSQTITVTSGDIDPSDNKVHIRFVSAPVLQNPAHAINQQPFFAVQLNNLTTGRTGSNPLFFEWNYSSQAGVPWITLTQAGTNPGSATNYTYTNWQASDIAPGNAFIHVGDSIQLVVLASGCSPGGHDGHLYLDNVTTAIPSGLWISASGAQSVVPGNNITYTYTYTNSGNVTINNVTATLNLPLQSNGGNATTFVSVTNPTKGTSTSCTGTSPVTCTMGTLLPGESGTFQLTVNVPSAWATSTGPVNNGNYPISGQGLSPLLGPLVQTNLLSGTNVSNLVIDTSGLPTTGSPGQAYVGTYTCANVQTSTASADAPNASCDIANLPAGLSFTGCTISPSNIAWVEPATIPINQTVTCNVSGTPSNTGNTSANLSTNANNNSDSTNNVATVTINISNVTPPPAPGTVVIPATVNNQPVLNPAIVCCGRPILLGDLPVAGDGPTTYTIIGQTGNISCVIGQSGAQTFLKLHGKPGSCTITGSKNGTVSAPLTVFAS